MSWFTIIGIGLLIWVAYDLITGVVWLHRAFERGSEPLAYWGAMGLWLALALTFFFWPTS